MELIPARESLEPFSLIGGPLHQLGRRLGLVRGTKTVALGLALGVGLWLVIIVIAAVQGLTDQLFDMSLVAAHARLVLVIPLFFLCESWIGPRMTAFIATIAHTGVLPPEEKPALDAEVARTHRMVNSWWPEAVCLVLAIWLDVTGLRLQTFGESGGYDSARSALAFLVYFHVGLTMFRFLLFRGAWRLAVWSWFLWRVSRLDLNLIPGHPDRAGGLGPLESVHERFTPMVAAFSILESASVAESISRGTLAVNAAYSWLAIVLIVDVVLFIGPLLVFTDKLWAARTKGVGLYAGLAARYVREFEAKWTGDSSERLLGTADIQSLADLANVVNVVKGMRWITVGPRLLTIMMIAAVAPLAPLLLFQYPLAELAQKFFSKLIGL